MVKQEDDNSNSSSDASSSSSFSSSSKSRKQSGNKELKGNNKNVTGNNNNLNNNNKSANPTNSISTLASLTSNNNNANNNSSLQQQQQQLLYNNSPNSLFKLNSLSNANQFNSQAIQLQQNLATMKSVANQLAAGNPTSSTSALSAISEQAYFQNSSVNSNNDVYKLPVTGALHLLTSSNSNRDSLTSKSNILENRERDRNALNSNCSNSSNSSNGSFNNGNNNQSGEIIVGEETVRKREMRLLKNREAARECRRKKKEYIKCLENRVAVLENQNKTLIDELKSLKELYCQNGDPSH